MKKNILIRPGDASDAARWDDAISSIWFYLLGPGYSAKNRDASTESTLTYAQNEIPIGKTQPIDFEFTQS